MLISLLEMLAKQTQQNAAETFELGTQMSGKRTSAASRARPGLPRSAAPLR